MTPEEIRTAIRYHNAVISFELEYRDDVIRRAIANKWSRRWIADTKWDANKRIQMHKRMIAEQYQLMARYQNIPSN